MPDPTNATLTARQQQWFASIREGLERETGRSLEQWAEIARACPEGKHRARLAWMKAHHGLGQNRASVVLHAAFPDDAEPDADLARALWSDPVARAIFAAIAARMVALPEVIVGQRKAFTAFSREFQFAAARPAGSAVLLGLAVDPAAYPLLRPAGRAGWSDRLKAEVRLGAPEEAAALADPIGAAWRAS